MVFPDFLEMLGPSKSACVLRRLWKVRAASPSKKSRGVQRNIKYSWPETTFRFCSFFRKSWNSVTLTFPAENLGNLENSGSGVGKVHSAFLEDRWTPLKRKGWVNFAHFATRNSLDYLSFRPEKLRSQNPNLSFGKVAKPKRDMQPMVCDDVCTPRNSLEGFAARTFHRRRKTQSLLLAPHFSKRIREMEKSQSVL